MSRSALWRQEAGVKERELHASGVLENAIQEGRQRPQKGLIALTKDDTFNFNPMLLQNISKSPYFLKCCSNLHDWNTLVDEIYYEVKHMEPWAQGHVKTPSTAFCLLLRLFTLRCSEKQMTLMLNHIDSPYIRCIGFLYLRYGTNPTEIWERFQPYLYDDEPIRISAKMTQKESTVGQYVRSLLTDMEYFGTLLPRLPVAVERDIKVKLMQAEKIEERALRHLQDKQRMALFETIGSKISALYGDEENPTTWYDAVVDRVVRTNDKTGERLARPKFLVTFPEYGNTELVSLGEIDMMQQRCAVDDANSKYDMGNFEGIRDFGDLKSGNRRYASDRDRNINNNNKRYKGNDNGYQNHYPGYNGRGSVNASNDNDPGPYSKRVKHFDKNDRSFDHGRSNISSSDSRYIPNERDLMEEVIQREREKSAAKGRAYASRPATFKESLSASRHGVEERKESSNFTHNRSSRVKHFENRTDESKEMSNNEQKQVKEGKTKPKTAEEMGAIAEKKRKLLARYG